MVLEYLQWDSDFFGFKIGKINILNEKLEELSTILAYAKSENYRLVYCFGYCNLWIDNLTLAKLGGIFVDAKIIFTCDVQGKSKDVSEVYEYDSNNVNYQLLELSYISGKYSRFRIDPLFDPNDFKRLYKTWIENSVNKQIADKIFVVKFQGKIAGMVTVKIKDKYGDIGLIAVDPLAQNKGYGKQLIGAVNKYLLEAGIFMIEVTTQLENKQACIFYQKCGMKEKNVTNIYHFWL